MSNNDEDDLDFSQVPDDAVDEFYRQAELNLDNTLKVALASDSRASTLTGTLGAATAALLVLAANIDGKDKVDAPLLVAVLTVAFFLLIGSVFCARAARPVEFHIPGYHPRVLYEAAASVKHIKLAAASDIQIRLDKNLKYLRTSAKLLSKGRFTAFVSLPLGIISYFLSSHWAALSLLLPSWLRDHLP